MNEWLKKILERIRGLWGKWSLSRKLIFAGIALAVIVAVVLMVTVSSSPALTPVIDAPIRDEDARDRIITRINEEGVKTTVSSTGVIQVQDEKTARRLRSILIREDLIPQGTDPWAIFDRERWTLTDFERDVNLQRAITQLVTDHIRALDDVDNANVTLVKPESKLFASEQSPVTASVIITPRPGSDITTNRKKIEGIQKILKFAVEGLKDENIVIADQSGLVLNDFEGMAAWDRLSLIEREQKIERQREMQYRAMILKALQSTFTEDRVRDLNVRIEMDMSKKNVTTDEFFPITLTDDNPNTPYDDSSRVNSITRSSSKSTTQWEGTGFNPQGPPGVEGQTPPAFKDMDNLYGKVNQETVTQNEEVNSRHIEEERSPEIRKITVSVNIDGQHKWKYDEKGKPVVLPDKTIEREYIPVPAEVISNTQLWIQNAVGYSQARGDSVSVHNIEFDRTEEFRAEDAAYFRKGQMQLLVVIVLAGIVALLLFFVVFRLIAREIEKRKRLKEEERARLQALARENAIRDAEAAAGMEVSMSVEERKRMELQEAAINLAKEHPGDVAQLIRTWLLED
jgi:flagellar M-ring protein FliF